MLVDLTIVRTKQTKEIVAVYEYMNDVTELWWKIDEITDPGQCEYADFPLVDIPLEIIFPISRCELTEDECVNYTGQLSDLMSSCIAEIIEESEFTEFTEIYPGIEYDAIQKEINSEVF